MRRETVNGKEIKGVANRHLYSRISYLHQAAQYLASASSNASGIDITSKDRLPSQTEDNPSTSLPGRELDSETQLASSSDSKEANSGCSSNQALRLSSHLLAVCRRAKVKASRNLKRSICKRCNELLVPGKTAVIRMENKSKRGRKPWADVLVAECQRCGLEKRYPVGQDRQYKKKDRTVVQVSGQA